MCLCAYYYYYCCDEAETSWVGTRRFHLSLVSFQTQNGKVGYVKESSAAGKHNNTKINVYKTKNT